jgi:hypothetical protein
VKYLQLLLGWRGSLVVASCKLLGVERLFGALLAFIGTAYHDGCCEK